MVATSIDECLTLPPEQATSGDWGRTPWWTQLYVLRDRGLTGALIDRAVAAGASAIVLTVDTPLVGRKRRGLRDVRSPERTRSCIAVLRPETFATYSAPLTSTNNPPKRTCG